MSGSAGTALTSRQHDVEGAAASGSRALRPGLASVGLHVTLHDGQTQAGAAALELELPEL